MNRRIALFLVEVLFVACGKHGAVNSQQLEGHMPRVDGSTQGAFSNPAEGGDPQPPSSLQDASWDLLWSASICDSAFGAENLLCQANCATSVDLPWADRQDPSVCFRTCVHVIAPQSPCSEQ